MAQTEGDGLAFLLLSCPELGRGTRASLRYSLAFAVCTYIHVIKNTHIYGGDE